MDIQKKLADFDRRDKSANLEKKRVFIGLITAASVLVCGGLVLLWFIPHIGFQAIHPAASWFFGVITALAIILILWATIGLVFNIQLGRSLPFTKRLRGLIIRIFLPLMVGMGKVFGISKQRVQSSFIKVNNKLVKSETGRFLPEEILLLMPHCLQNSRCSVRLTYDTNNCKRCGKCPIDGLLALAEHYGVHLAIATGGTIARRIVVKIRPRLIIAVACERDLSSGIQDTYPLPVYGVMNKRPNGPCLDTVVALPMLEKALQEFLISPPAVKNLPMA